MINFNPSISPVSPKPLQPTAPVQKPEELKKTDFGDLVNKFVGQTEQNQQASETAIKDMLAGKNEDINSIVAQVAKADMSFKLLVGVRNKIIDAYKQTMQMQI
ncbi:MAG: flagellar hook-basal body complex protein FliE [Sedimentisphaerales bacterium]|nr:flagellar hook-basal body complex protein FliE [Sedimentisphaerales bacterium]